MKTSVIPAQITTVEDRIAGNLNLTQIVLLLMALIIATVIYAVFPYRMQFTYYKLPLIFLGSTFCMVLALRIRGKVLLDWLLVLVRFNVRPSYYLYNKNDLYLRDFIPSEEPKVTKKVAIQQAKTKVEEKIKEATVNDLAKIEQLLVNPKFQLSFKFGKGGLNVVASEIQK